MSNKVASGRGLYYRNISLPALIKIMTLACGDDPPINLTHPDPSNPHFMLVEIDTGQNQGSCFYDMAERIVFGATTLWDETLDYAIEVIKDCQIDKHKRALARLGTTEKNLFSEEEYRREKGLDDHRMMDDGCPWFGDY